MSFESYVDNQLKRQETVLINTLERVGQLAVNEARDHGSYLDQTANLRSSVGYMIAKDGVVISRSSFESVSGEKGDGKQGSIDGANFANKIATQTSGLTLIVVAGMNYATYVETHRNVLASSQILAEREVPKLLKALGFIK